MTCRKHDPEPTGDWMRQAQGHVVCKLCGREGRRSNGQRRYGRPARIIWFRFPTPTKDSSHGY